MADAVSDAAKSKVKSAMSGFINPSLIILKHWQGVLEMVARGVVLVRAALQLA